MMSLLIWERQLTAAISIGERNTLSFREEKMEC